MPKQKQLIGYIAKEVKEKFNAEVSDNIVKFPKELGVEHPFDFEAAEKVYKRISIVSGAVNKYVDNIVGDFTVKAQNPNSQALIDSFIKNSEFTIKLREWIREAIVKGNGFMELDLEDEDMRVVNANTMFVDRDRNGKVKGYNQFKGKIKSFNSKKILPLKTNKIAHLKINKIADEAYGLGYVWINERAIETLVQQIQDHTKIISRKAGAPYHVKVGRPGEKVSNADVDEAKRRLTYQRNTTEWVTDGNVEITSIEFKDVGKNLTDSIKQTIFMIIAGMEVPEVLLGSGQLNEGIAKVQLESWQRKIAALREEIESVVEQKIFQPLLLVNNLNDTIEFIWNLPGEEEINRRIEKVKELLGLPSLSPEMKAALEIELARLLNFDELERILVDPAKAREQEEARREESPEREQEEEEIPQPEVPGAKPNANQSQAVVSLKQEAPQTVLSHADMTLQQFVNLQEIQGFNYTDFLVKILQFLNVDKFETLKAISEQDIVNGLLRTDEIERLRIILKEGFKKNKTIREIEEDIQNNIELRDRISGGKVVAAAENRPLTIARTETVRVANEGLKDLYKENGIEKVRFLAALSDRTCPICEGLNAQVFEMNELQVGINQPPIHTGCRCSLVSVVE